MFSDRGWTTLLKDDIIDKVLLVGHLMGGLISMLAGYAYSKATGLSAVNTTMLTSLGKA
jgi:pimeloyl-ACP methyl ester carboxylesterase